MGFQEESREDAVGVGVEVGNVLSVDTEPEEDEMFTADDRFRFLGRHFSDSIEALRETHGELSAAAANLDSLSQIWAAALNGSKRLTDDDRELLRPVFKDVPEDGLTGHELVERLWDALADADWGPAFTLSFARRVFRPRREPIFHNAILISVVAAFESHFAKLAEEYYRAAPEALHNLPKEAAKEFSLKDLQAMDSIEDAIEMAIEQRVTALSFGSLADWKKFFADRLNIDMSGLVDSWSSIQEIFERRHCIVHNEAAASRRYVRNYPQTELREPLHADGDYVREAMEGLELLGTLLQMAVWSKFAVDEQEVIDAAELIGFEALKGGRWEYSMRIYEKWQLLPLSEAEQRMAKVNLWIARKHIHGVDSIRDDVESWDVSGSDEIYAFAKLCLLEDLDRAFSMLPTMIERQKVEGKELATWPLLEPLRDDVRIQEHAEIMRDYLSDETESEIVEDERDEPIDGSSENAAAP